jgi:hypothetical protein
MTARHFHLRFGGRAMVSVHTRSGTSEQLLRAKRRDDDELVGVQMYRTDYHQQPFIRIRLERAAPTLIVAEVLRPAGSRSTTCPRNPGIATTC